jgi:hypothetical protein
MRACLFLISLKHNYLMNYHCSICKSDISQTESTIICDACKTLYHLDCWNENGGCGTSGCLNLPALKFKSGPTLKTCPACAEEISIEEIICPVCNERFDTISPIVQSDFRKQKQFSPQTEKPAEQKGAILLLIAGVLGFTAPFNLVIGGIWYANKRKILKELSPIHNILAIIGLSVSFLYSVLFIIYLSNN